MSGKNDLPEWVIEYVCAVMRGYDERARYIERFPSTGNKVTRIYRTQNAAIDNAFGAECSPAERRSIEYSIIHSLPYERVGECPCGRRRFYDLKWNVIRSAARNLNIFKP